MVNLLKKHRRNKKTQSNFAGSDLFVFLRALFSPLASVQLLFLLLSGCAVGPNYQRPQLDIPETFRGPPIPTGTNSLGELPWWEVFHDEMLHELIRAALTNNYDLRIAIARVEQARYVVWQNRAGFFPMLNYEGQVGRGKNATAGNPVFSGGKTLDFFAAAGTASWELDIWGRIRRLNEASRSQFFATEEARRDVVITLVSDVATAYFQLLALDKQLEIARRTTNAFGESLRIFSQRLAGGIVSKLETSAAQAALASAAATVPELERQVVVLENQINVLLGRNIEPVPRSKSMPEQPFWPEVPPGLPSTLLRRRPDIREAEQTLRAANAQVGVAFADFFPHLSLTALFGQVSPELSLFTAGGANAWSLAANLTGPLFQGGRLVGRYHETQAIREQEQLRYQYSMLNALREVSNALVAREKYAQSRVEQARAVEAYSTAVQVATERYVAGRAGYFEVLQEQQLLFPAENDLVQTQLNQVLSVVQLYRALGGGWEVSGSP